jgi:F-type H+-transporting ATPase subunit gamma
MNLREVKKKVKSVSNVKKITRAMQLVSAVKMKKAQEKARNGEPYRRELKEAIQRVVSSSSELDSPFLFDQEKAQEKNLYIIISSDKGLCGSFLSSIQKMIIQQTDPATDEYLTVGKKGSQFIAAVRGKIIADFEAHDLTTRVSAILGLAIEQFLGKQCKRVYVIYNRFVSTMTMEPEKEQIFPVPKEQLQKETKAESDYIIEPPPNVIFDQVLRDYLEEKLRGALISSEAAEHSARMIAMKNATDNANDVIYNLTLVGNKLRQEKITSELLDMVTAKESVEG